MGPRGLGRGGIAAEEETRAAFVERRDKVRTGRGSIIGQYLVDGEQVRGDETSSVQEIVSAAEHDATDAINRARIPRRYHGAIKKYFSDIQQHVGVDPNATEEDDASDNEAADDGPDE